MTTALARDGYEVHGAVLADDARAALLDVFARRVGEAAAGRRDGLDEPAVAALAASPAVGAIVARALGPGAFAYRATLFDKTASANWPVAWHQDRVVPVRERLAVAGYSRWSQKPEGAFVEPPAAVHAGLLALRVDVDGSGPDNGGLRVVPGSHAAGVLSTEALARCVAAGPVRCPVIVPGGALAMRPLLVHGSQRSAAAGHRRVVHVEFSAAPLPGGVRFARRVAVVAE